MSTLSVQIYIYICLFHDLWLVFWRWLPWCHFTTDHVWETFSFSVVLVFCPECDVSAYLDLYDLSIWEPKWCKKNIECSKPGIRCCAFVRFYFVAISFRSLHPEKGSDAASGQLRQPWLSIVFWCCMVGLKTKLSESTIGITTKEPLEPVFLLFSYGDSLADPGDCGPKLWPIARSFFRNHPAYDSQNLWTCERLWTSINNKTLVTVATAQLMVDANTYIYMNIFESICIYIYAYRIRIILSYYIIYSHRNSSSSWCFTE